MFQQSNIFIQKFQITKIIKDWKRFNFSYFSKRLVKKYFIHKNVNYQTHEINGTIILNKYLGKYRNILVYKIDTLNMEKSASSWKRLFFRSTTDDICHHRASCRDNLTNGRRWIDDKHLVVHSIVRFDKKKKRPSPNLSWKHLNNLIYLKIVSVIVMLLSVCRRVILV